MTVPAAIIKWAPEFSHRKADLSKISLQFAVKLAECHPREFRGGIVWGEKRIGKSVYSLKVAMQIFISMGCTKEEAWELALASLFFHPHKLLQVLKYLNDNDLVWPVIILDDAGRAAGSHIWFTDRATYYALRDVFDMIGTVVSGFIATTPNFEKLIDMIRGDISFYRIEIVKVGGQEWGRVANAYNIKQLHSGKIRVKSKKDPKGGFMDDFSALLRDDWYIVYSRIRRSFTGDVIDFALSRFGQEESEVPASPDTITPPGPHTPPRASRRGAGKPERDEDQSIPPSPSGPGRSLLSRRALSDEYDERYGESTSDSEP